MSAHAEDRPLLSVVEGFSRAERYNSRSFDRQVAHKYLFKLNDGNVIETSGYQHYLGDTPVDYSVDISSMVGCPMRCTFCESALINYDRTLLESEMVAQVAKLVEWHGATFPRITCSFQGIGEASAIPDLVLQVSKEILALDERNEISIATVGAHLNAFQIWREGGVEIDNLQLSCSGTTEEHIRKVMPRGPKIGQLVRELDLCGKSENINKVKLNYILMAGFNDSPDDVRRLVDMVQGTSIVVKISALNLTEASRRSGLKQAPEERAWDMSAELNANGIKSYVYGPFNDTNVSCGQLAFAAKDGPDARSKKTLKG